MQIAQRLLLSLLALAASGCAWADATLTLDDSTHPFEAWHAVRVLEDADAALGIEDVLRQRSEFLPANVPMNNFGQRPGALWLHVPLLQASHDTRWVLELNYPALKEIDVYVVQHSTVLRHVHMGDTVPAAHRPMRTLSHAVMLELAAGSRYDLYLRVRSSSALVVPIRLHHSDSFVAIESAQALLQGLMLGVALMLLSTSLINGLSLRDRVFIYYALMILGVSMFFVSFSGLGYQFLWDSQTGVFEKVSPWGALLAMTGASLFVSGALDLQHESPRTAQLLHLAALAGATVIAVSMLNLLDYRQTAFAATVLGPIPIVLALYESIRRARRGHRVAVYMTLGWGAYTIGGLCMAALLRGWLPVNFWTRHLFQFASVVEMFAWMRVLSLRIQVLRQHAERSIAEKQALHSLAHTDPLTGLPNRRGLSEALEAALPGVQPDSALAVLMLDLDGFKAINDRLGHDAGDELLVQVAQRVRGALRAVDLVARLGGDEFVVVMAGINSESSPLLIGRKLLDAFNDPFVVKRQSCRVGLTIGYAMAPQDGIEAGDLLRRADAAMYAGKQGGRGCIRRGAASAGLAVAT